MIFFEAEGISLRRDTSGSNLEMVGSQRKYWRFLGKREELPPT